MNGSDSLLDSTSTGTGSSFQLVRRGYDPLEVQAFARAVSSELQRLARENEELRDQLRSAAQAPAPGVARIADATEPAASSAAALPIDDASVAQYLGAETTRLLQAARETAGEIVRKAEMRSDDIVAGAENDARRIREEAAADAAHERRVAADEARRLIADATEHRRVVLAELAQQRSEASGQLRDLGDGRTSLVRTLRDVSVDAAHLAERLEAVDLERGDGPSEAPPADASRRPAAARTGESDADLDFAPPAAGTRRLAPSIGAETRSASPWDASDDEDGEDNLFVLEG
ncbi:MAG: hypothetical protein R2715_00535 [Ilumatobacteraceae bacterium]